LMLNHQAVAWQQHDSIIYGGVLILVLGAIGGVMTRRSAQGGRSDVRFRGVASTGRRNTGVKSLCWGFKLQGLTWSFV
jgi:hypothetical protein